MTRVTDDDLDAIALAMKTTASTKTIKRWAAVHAELLALRKVADAAARFHKADVDSESKPYDDMPDFEELER